MFNTIKYEAVELADADTLIEKSKTLANGPQLFNILAVIRLYCNEVYEEREVRTVGRVAVCTRSLGSPAHALSPSRTHLPRCGRTRRRSLAT